MNIETSAEQPVKQFLCFWGDGYSVDPKHKIVGLEFFTGGESDLGYTADDAAAIDGLEVGEAYAGDWPEVHVITRMPDLEAAAGPEEPEPEALVQANDAELANELRHAHQIILNALQIMSPAQSHRWAAMNEETGCASEGGTRYHERKAVLDRVREGE